jgi:GNAT superfamily N-acetyltransferase
MTASIRHLTIEEFDADDADAVAASYRVSAASQAASVPDLPAPCRYHHEAVMRHPWPGRTIQRLLARVDGDAAGYLVIGYPTLDNPENAFVEISVAPGYRRRGVGRALHARAVDLARAAGRKRIMADAVQTMAGGPERDAAGSAFAAAMGMRPANTEIRRKLEISHIDPADHDLLLSAAWQRADGYSVVRWRDRVPDEYVDDVALLDSRMITDAPIGDLALEPEKVDAERIRGSEAARSAHGSRTYAVGARHDASGRLVALTAIMFEKTVPEHAWQAITLVHPDHRGHRLGTIVKIENLRYTLAHEAALAAVDTWNAEVNEYMIAINEAMGFRAIDAWVDWQQEI